MTSTASTPSSPSTTWNGRPVEPADRGHLARGRGGELAVQEQRLNVGVADLVRRLDLGGELARGLGHRLELVTRPVVALRWRALPVHGAAGREHLDGGDGDGLEVGHGYRLKNGPTATTARLMTITAQVWRSVTA
jgi:hypothetical protein